MLLRDIRQSLLNCIMLAHARSAPNPWQMISTRLHYVKPQTVTPASEAKTVRHTVTMGALKTKVMVLLDANSHYLAYF